jgi:hypothetical protein
VTARRVFFYIGCSADFILYTERRTSGIFRRISDLQVPGLGEGPEAAVVGFLHIVGETAGRQLFR